ncbi:prostaglandin reductase 1-like isoform X2 [Branchiostoma lanceolatum]|uniref:prostaglandin reductase 1-like isoform X2 n=1 Tax=Branchiostoma lanceolatum TaxID=7740 RepID=UPI0034519F99
MASCRGQRSTVGPECVSRLFKSVVNMVKSKRFVVARHFDGLPKESDFQLVEEETPDLKDGEILVASIFSSVDPYMRTLSRRLSEGVTMVGECCARVAESKSSDFPVGTVIVHQYGWRTHAVLDTENQDPPRKAPADYPKDLPLSLLLGAVGIPGLTAYFGLLKCLEAKEGETVFVNAAAGATGSIVGQIARIKGCKAVGSAGSDAKVAWLKELGFDAAFNYKTVSSLDAALKEAAPNGIDCYFDNVGGDFTTTVLNHMNLYGRVAIVGGISTYNDKDPSSKGAFPYKAIQGKQLTLIGFVVSRWLDQWPQGKAQMMQWIKEVCDHVSPLHYITNFFTEY